MQPAAITVQVDADTENKQEEAKQALSERQDDMSAGDGDMASKVGKNAIRVFCKCICIRSKSLGIISESRRKSRKKRMKRTLLKHLWVLTVALAKSLKRIAVPLR